MSLPRWSSRARTRAGHASASIAATDPSPESARRCASRPSTTSGPRSAGQRTSAVRPAERWPLLPTGANARRNPDVGITPAALWVVMPMVKTLGDIDAPGMTNEPPTIIAGVDGSGHSADALALAGALAAPLGA